MPEQWLAIADADRIHDYVFSPHELKMIRGASALQTELNEEETAEVLSATNGTSIYSGGGTTLAKFDKPQDAANFCSAMEELYRSRTCIGTTSTAWVEYPADEFHATRKRLGVLLERRKSSRADHRHNGGNPFWAGCQSCGLYEATVCGGDQLLCRACQIREHNSNKSRYLPKGIHPPRDFGKIAGIARPQNYLAIVYIDVDRLGRELDKHRTEGSFRDFSGTVKAAVGCVTSELEGLLIQANRSYYEVLLLGGDDAVVALPAQFVFEFLRRFQKAYREKLPGEDAPRFSAAVVFANYHYPIAEFLRVAEEMLRRAKEESLGVSSVNFEAITSAVAGTRREAARLPLPTARPYSLESFLAMEGEIRELKAAGAPTSKMRALYEIAYRGEQQGQLDYCWLLSRLEPRHRKGLRKIVEEAQWDGFFWRPKERVPQAYTRGADVGELWDFIHELEIND